MQSLISNLPPSLNNAPLEMQAEILKMEQLSIEELLKIAYSRIADSEQEKHLQLLEKNQAGLITESEIIQLKDLRMAADRLILKKAYAWAILKLRNYPIPNLDQLPEE